MKLLLNSFSYSTFKVKELQSISYKKEYFSHSKKANLQFLVQNSNYYQTIKFQNCFHTNKGYIILPSILTIINPQWNGFFHFDDSGNFTVNFELKAIKIAQLFSIFTSIVSLGSIKILSKHDLCFF